MRRVRARHPGPLVELKPGEIFEEEEFTTEITENTEMEKRGKDLFTTEVTEIAEEI